MHLIVDAHTPKVDLITSRPAMANWLKQLAWVIKMTPMAEPFILGYPWPDGTDHDALTCFLPIGESGISVHCYPEKRFVFLDIFSCNDFEEGKVLDYVIGTLGAYNWTVLLLDRGVKEGEIIAANVRNKRGG